MQTRGKGVPYFRSYSGIVLAEIMQGCVVGSSPASRSGDVELFSLERDSCIWECSKNKSTSNLQL